MAITILAVLFLVFILVIALLGYKSVIRPESSPQGSRGEKCYLCMKRFEKALLVERQIGDYKLVYFCRECVKKLYADLGDG